MCGCPAALSCGLLPTSLLSLPYSPRSMSASNGDVLFRCRTHIPARPCGSIISCRSSPTLAVTGKAGKWVMTVFWGCGEARLGGKKSGLLRRVEADPAASWSVWRQKQVCGNAEMRRERADVRQGQLTFAAQNHRAKLPATAPKLPSRFAERLDAITVEAFPVGERLGCQATVQRRFNSTNLPLNSF